MNGVETVKIWAHKLNETSVIFIKEELNYRQESSFPFLWKAMSQNDGSNQQQIQHLLLSLTVLFQEIVVIR